MTQIQHRSVKGRAAKMLLVGLFALASAQAATIKLATLSPLSGNLTATGTEIKRGSQLAVDEQRDSFKALGYDLSLVAYDDQATPTVAAPVVQTLVADPLILGVVGAYNSSISALIGKAGFSSGLAVISPGSTNDALTQSGWTNFSRLVPSDSVHAVAAVNYIVDELKASSIFVISDNTTYGNGLSLTLIKALKSRKMPLTNYQGAATEAEIDAVIKKIGTNPPAVVYCACLENVISPVLKGLRKSGIKSVFMGAGGLDSPGFLKNVGLAAEGAIYTTGYGPITSYTNAVDFSSKFQEAFQVKPTGVAAYAYDAATALLTAMKTAGASGKLPTRRQVSVAVQALNLPSCFGTNDTKCVIVSGAISFSDTGERQPTRLLVMKFNRFLQPQIAKIYTSEPKASK